LCNNLDLILCEYNIVARKTRNTKLEANLFRNNKVWKLISILSDK